MKAAKEGRETREEGRGAPFCTLHSALGTVVVIGIGDSGPDSLTQAALAEIAQADVLAGGDRNLSFFPEHRAERIRIGADVPSTAQELQRLSDAGRRVVVLASGDPFLFGIGPALVKQFGRQRLNVIPGVSSVQLAFAKAGESWHDAVVLSAHGRPLPDIVPQALAAHKIAVLTDGSSTPSAIAEALLAAGMENCRAVVCEHLGGPAERVLECALRELPAQTFALLSVLLLFREPNNVQVTFGRHEREFRSLRKQITKAEVRALTLSKLHLHPGGVLWDVGAGSGALSVEAARLMPRGCVYAVEREADQRQIIEANARKFGATNVRIVAGEAPEALASLPKPNSVFLGGSGGRLVELLGILPRPFVANVTVIEHLGLILKRFPSAEVTQVSISRSTEIADGRRLAALNPVYVVSVNESSREPMVQSSLSDQRAADSGLRTLDSGLWTAMVTGKLYAIGLGPGDPELITVKAQRLLRELDAIYIPVREGHESLARKIAERWVNSSKLQELPFRMSKNPAENAQRWRAHAQTLGAAASSGRDVGFLTEGDPLLYSTFGNLLEALRSDFPEIPLEFVPGVTSVTASAAACGVPLGQEDRRVAIVPASGDVLHALATFDTVVILKVSMNLDSVLKALRSTGRVSEARYVERATWPEQRIVDDVESLRARKLDYFGQIIVAR